MRTQTNFASEVANFAATVQVSNVESERDRDLFLEVLIARRELLRDLSTVPLHSGYWRALRSLRVIDAKAFFQSMKQLRNVVTSAEYRNGSVSFKHLRDIAPQWCITPLATFAKNEGFVDGYAKAIQWVSFDSKVNFRDSDYKSENAQEYLEREVELHTQTYPESTLNDLNRIAIEWFGDFSPSEHYPRPHFTSGATASLRRAEATPRHKIEDLIMTDQDLEYIRLRERPDDFGTFLPGVWTNTTNFDPAMVVDFVPKSPLTNRVISKEPTYRMFLQSDLRDILEEYCSRKGLPFDLHDQETSRRLALEGSRDGEYTTFDLSAASDTVTLTHVRKILKGTVLLELLIAVRTKVATCDFFPGNRTLELEKFAPMGSNCCFIVETIIFSLICELAVRRILGRRGRRFGDYRVYGDDMVFLTILAKEIHRILSELHFQVNDEKSFADRQCHTFREACGVEAIDGVDITPFRISRRYVGALEATSVVKGGLPDPASFLGYVDGLNRLLCHGYLHTRKLLMNPLCQASYHRKLWRVSYSQFTADSARWSRGESSIGQYPCPTLLTPDCTEANWQLRRTLGTAQGPDGKTHRDPSQPRARCLTIATRPNADPKDSLDYALWWLRRPVKDDEGPCARLVTPEEPSGNSGSKLKWRHTLV